MIGYIQLTEFETDKKIILQAHNISHVKQINEEMSQITTVCGQVIVVKGPYIDIKRQIACIYDIMWLQSMK